MSAWLEEGWSRELEFYILLNQEPLSRDISQMVASLRSPTLLDAADGVSVIEGPENEFMTPQAILKYRKAQI